MKYRYAKQHGLPFFKTPNGDYRAPSDLTPLQVAMQSWFEFYDWVLGPDGPHPKPSEAVLNDDEALDMFLEKWKRDLNKKK